MENQAPSEEILLCWGQSLTSSPTWGPKFDLTLWRLRAVDKGLLLKESRPPYEAETGSANNGMAHGVIKLHYWTRDHAASANGAERVDAGLGYPGQDIVAST